MNDLKFAYRQVLKTPGFTAVAVLTLGSGDRTLGGRQSTPKASRLPAAVLRRDSFVSRMALKLSVRRLGATRRILPVFRFRLIQQRAQSRTWARIADDAFPRRVAIQLWQQGRQTRHSPNEVDR